MRTLFALFGLGLAAVAFGFEGEDTYGPGIHQDRYGRAFQFHTDDGAPLPPNVRVRPNAYGPGIGQDEYGRPVRAREFGGGAALDPFAVDDDD